MTELHERMQVPTETLRYRDAAVRREAVLRLVRETGYCSTGSLSAQLGVSRMTVRRDIRELELQNLVRASHGGVQSVVSAVAGGIPFQQRRDDQTAQKAAIARRAVELIGKRDSVLGIDGGTTAFEVARRLFPAENLMVVSASLPVLNELIDRPKVEVVGVGGVLHPDTATFAGPQTLEALSSIRLSTALLTASALRNGVMYCGNAFDADTKRQLINIADRVVLLVDSSKLSRVAPFHVAPVSQVDLIVVDDGISPEDLAELQGFGVTVDVVQSGEL